VTLAAFPPVVVPPVAPVAFESCLFPLTLVELVLVLLVPAVAFDRSCLFPFTFVEPVFVLLLVPSVAFDFSCLFPLPVEVVVSVPAPPLVRAPVPSVVRIFPALPVFCAAESPVAPVLLLLVVLVSRPACLLPPLPVTLVPPLLLVLLPVSRDRPLLPLELVPPLLSV